MKDLKHDLSLFDLHELIKYHKTMIHALSDLLVEIQTENAKPCDHKNTRIWEPHLAGARKCNDCGMVYNPNRSYMGKDPWFFEVIE